MISRNNIMDIKSRRDIYQFISENPGLHTSEISARMNIPRSTIRHHLRYLLKQNLIHLKADSKDKRLYACDQMGLKDKEILGLLRQEIPFKIIMYLLFPGYCSKSELAKELKVYPSTIHFHLKKLLDIGIIRPVEVEDGKLISYQDHKPPLIKKPVKREILYMWKNHQTKKDVYRIIITHKRSMLDPSIIDSYYHLTRETKTEKKCKKIISLNPTIDNILKGLEEIAYFPYHF